jgi:hypothetical protein
LTNDPLIPTPTDDQKRVGGYTRPRAKALGVLTGQNTPNGDSGYTNIGTGSDYERVGREVTTGKRPDPRKGVSGVPHSGGARPEKEPAGMKGRRR